MSTPAPVASAAPSSMPATSALPLIAQVGFAGARKLFHPKEHPEVNRDAFEKAVADQLTGILAGMASVLNLNPDTFRFCGISQVAIGGDFAFTQACHTAGWTQRIFFPQHRDEYFTAVGSEGPDFSEAQIDTARDLLALEHIIQERLVSESPDRHERFHEANLEIARVSDLLIALIRPDQQGKRGGTVDLIEIAKKRKLPLLEICIHVKDNGAPQLESQWHDLDQFRPPFLPAKLQESIPTDALDTLAANSPSRLPKAADYLAILKNLGSQQANWQRKLFKWAALVIIGAHIFATIIAVIALKVHSGPIPWLLGTEIVLLFAGFGVHHYLHRTHAVERWALFRLVAEIARSLRAIGGFHVYLEHLFALPFPETVRPLLRTVSVLHLHDTSRTNEDWENQRTHYLSERLAASSNGQIGYNRRIRDEATRSLQTANRVFILASLFAIVATTTKLLATCLCLPGAESMEKEVANIAGALAIILPVIAVASLSLAAAFDLHAREHIADEMIDFLEKQEVDLRNASTAREYGRLLVETESRLLGETVNWYARRSYLSVA